MVIVILKAAVTPASAPRQISRQRQILGRLVSLAAALRTAAPAVATTASSSAAAPRAFATAASDEIVVYVSSDDEEDEERSNSSTFLSNRSSTSTSSIEGLNGAFYGGYGECFNCGRRGHWAPGCPEG